MRLGDRRSAVAARPSEAHRTALSLYLDIEGIPPELIIGFCSGMPAIGLSKREIFKHAALIKSRLEALTNTVNQELREAGIQASEPILADGY